MDDVALTFDDEALQEIARKSLERKTGARGLRAIMENVMMDYMYRVPTDDSIRTLAITKDLVDENIMLIEREEDIVHIEDIEERKESA